MGEVLTFSINYETGVWMAVFYEIDIVAHNRSPDSFLWNVNTAAEL